MLVLVGELIIGICTLCMLVFFLLFWGCLFLVVCAACLCFFFFLAFFATAPWEGESMTNTFHTLSSRHEFPNSPCDIGICTQIQIQTHKQIQLQIQSQTNKYIYTEKVKTWPTPFILCHRDTSAATLRVISEYAQQIQEWIQIQMNKHKYKCTLRK